MKCRVLFFHFQHPPHKKKQTRKPLFRLSVSLSPFHKIPKFGNRYLTPNNMFRCLSDQTALLSVTGRERLIRRHSSARFCFELSENSN